MKTALFAILVSFLSSVTALSQEPSQEPLTQLPSNVTFEDGTFGLFTDWESDKDGRLKVFVVNGSKKPVRLDYGYGSPTFFLEAKNKDGQWDRATVHIDQMCGTGLGVFDLKPGNFSVGQFAINQSGDERSRLKGEIKKIRNFMARARMTKEAHEAKLAEVDQLESQLNEQSKIWAKREVRIRTYSQFANANGVSNSGQVSVDLRVIENAKRDSMAIRTASLERLEAIITGKEVFEPVQMGGLPISPLRVAIYSVGRADHSIEHATAILERVVAESKDETLVNMAKSRLAAKPFK